MCAAQPGGGRQRKGPSNRRLGGATFQSRPSERACGRVEIDKPDKGERPAGAVTSDKWAVRPAGGPLRERQTGQQGKREGSGRKTHAETRRSGDAKMENSQTIPTIPDNFLRRQLKQLGTTLSKCRADNSARRLSTRNKLSFGPSIAPGFLVPVCTPTCRRQAHFANQRKQICPSLSSFQKLFSIVSQVVASCLKTDFFVQLIPGCGFRQVESSP